MLTVITENDVSKWDDETGVKYHFPARYLKYLQTGTQVIYYKGKMTDKQFAGKRLTKEPHYFGTGRIGRLTKDGESNSYYAEILDFERFPIAVLSRYNGTYLEEIPPTQKTNYWRNGVRPLTKDVYHRILKQLATEIPSSALNDQTDTEYVSTHIEGGKKVVYTTKYERSRESRDKAIHIHGYTCEGCGFNFKDFYGDWGEGYIHVHHKKPLYEVNGKMEVNPKLDLAVVCANCHAMIHRRKDNVLSIEELREIIKKNKKHS